MALSSWLHDKPLLRLAFRCSLRIFVHYYLSLLQPMVIINIILKDITMTKEADKINVGSCKEVFSVLCRAGLFLFQSDLFHITGECRKDSQPSLDVVPNKYRFIKAIVLIVSKFGVGTSV